MSTKLVRKSLLKFLQDNLTGIVITDDSNNSDIKTITNLYSQQNLLSTNTSDTSLTGTVNSIVGISLTGNGTLFTTELSVGDSIKINGVIGVVETIYTDTTLDFTETLSWGVSGGETIVKPSAKEFVLLQEAGAVANRYSTNDDLTGYSITANGETIALTSWDNTNNQITIPNVFTDEVLPWDEDTQTGTELDMGMDYLLYVKSPHFVNDKSSDYYSFGQMPRWDMYLKVKDDSNKDKIDDKLQEIRNLIFSNKGNFHIYNEAQDTILGNSQLVHTSYEEKEIVDNNNDLQSILITFIGRYWMNYIK